MSNLDSGYSFVSRTKLGNDDPRELTMRFAAFLLRVVDEFPVSGRYLGEAISSQAVALIDAVMREEWQGKGTKLISGLETHSGKAAGRHLFAPESVRILLQLKTYLTVSRDAGYVSRVIQHISNDVISELEELINSQERTLEQKEKELAQASLLDPKRPFVGKAVDIRNEEVPHNEERRQEQPVPHSFASIQKEITPVQNQLPKPFVQPIKDREAAILMLMKEKNPRRFKELKEHFAVSGRALRKNLARLVAQNRIMRHGRPPQSWYEIVEAD